ncbi:MAG: hypothetical protein ABEK17_02625 [Candidatus Aenigmatarchaeota archaeon]
MNLEKMNKGAALSLEYVVKIVILMVVAVVIIGIMTGFSDDLKIRVDSMLFGKDDEGPVKTEEVNVGSFSTVQVRNYAKSCWEKTGTSYQGDVICYVLKGSMSSVNKNNLRQSLENMDNLNVELNNFNPNSNMAMVKFKDIGDKIIIEN